MRRGVCGITIRLLITPNHRPHPLPRPRSRLRPLKEPPRARIIIVLSPSSIVRQREAPAMDLNWLKIGLKSWRKCVTSGDEDGPFLLLLPRPAHRRPEDERRLVTPVPSRPPLRLRRFTFFVVSFLHLVIRRIPSVSSSLFLCFSLHSR